MANGREAALKLPLPEHVYIPSQTARHSEGFLDGVIALAPTVTESNTAQCNVVWHFGLRLIDEGFYWEAHEVLEAVWMRARNNSAEKALVQGVIHIANAKLKLRMERTNAHRRLRVLAVECFQRAFSSEPVVMGFSAKEMRIL